MEISLYFTLRFALENAHVYGSLSPFMSNVSYYAMKTISFQKIKEFFSEFQYTIISPLVSTIIYVVILNTISNYYSLDLKGSYLNFVVPGIIIMVVMQVTYQNISESLIFMKQILMEHIQLKAC